MIDNATSKEFLQVGEYVIRDPAKLKKLQKELNLQPPFPNGKLKEIVIKRSLPVIHANLNSPHIGENTPLSAYEVRNVQYEGTVCGLQVIQRTSGPGPGTLTISVTNTVSNSFISTVTISASIVSAAVGFNVTETESITDSYTMDVPLGEIGYIEAHPYLDIYSFEVWDNPWYWWGSKVGEGEAYRVSGICFVSWTY